MLVLVSAFKGITHITIELIQNKKQPSDVIGLQVFSIYWIFYKVYFFVQIIILSKWFSRVYFPLIGALFLTSENIAYLLMVYFPSPERAHEKGEGEGHEWLSIISWVVPLIIGIFQTQFLPIDPIDRGLIINETAMNLSQHLQYDRQSKWRQILDLNEFEQ